MNKLKKKQEKEKTVASRKASKALGLRRRHVRARPAEQTKEEHKQERKERHARARRDK